MVPAESASINVASLLPQSVSVTPDESAFLLDLGATTFSRSLGELCAACAAADGLVVPKPEFTGSLGSQISLPADLASATLASGAIELELTNGFGFDPLRPSATARGTLAMTISNGGTPLGSMTVDGADTRFAPGASLKRTIPLGPATVSGPIDVTVTISSPAGDPVRMDRDQRVSVLAAPGQVRITEANVSVSNKQVRANDVSFEFGGLDADIISRVERAALRLTLDNPFAVQGRVTATLRTPESDIVKEFDLTPGVATQRLEFAGDEIRTILRAPTATFSIGGGVSAVDANGISVRPSQVLAVGSGLELDILSTR